jgi:hypothetical protein
MEVLIQQHRTSRAWTIDTPFMILFEERESDNKRQNREKESKKVARRKAGRKEQVIITGPRPCTEDYHFIHNTACVSSSTPEQLLHQPSSSQQVGSDYAAGAVSFSSSSSLCSHHVLRTVFLSYVERISSTHGDKIYLRRYRKRKNGEKRGRKLEVLPYFRA